MHNNGWLPPAVTLELPAISLVWFIPSCKTVLSSPATRQFIAMPRYETLNKKGIL